MTLERKWGLLKFVVLYFVSGIGGTLLSALALPNSLGRLFLVVKKVVFLKLMLDFALQKGLGHRER
jgi:membrane associated rhomboid family serine protease